MCVSYYSGMRGSGGWGLEAGLKHDWTRTPEPRELASQAPRRTQHPEREHPEPTRERVGFDTPAALLVCSRAMRGLMMDYPLTIPAIVRRAATLFGHKRIVSRLAGSQRSIAAPTPSVLERVDAALRRACRPGRAPRRPGRDAGVGRPSAPRGLPRDSVDGRRAAHAQPAAAPRRSDPTSSTTPPTGS